MYNTLAYGAEGAQTGFLFSLMPFVIIIAIFYFILIMPQQKRQKKHLEMLNSIVAGDHVMTVGGMFGRVVSVIDGNNFIVEIAKDVNIKLNKSGISSKLIEEHTAEAKPEKVL